MNYESGVIESQGAHALSDGREDAGAGRRRTLIIALVLAALAAAAAYYFFRGGGEAQGPGGPAEAKGKREAQVPNVTVVAPGLQPIARTISATGTLAARRDLPVGVAGEGGLVTRVLVEPGQWVGAGQVLATVDRSVQTQTLAQLAAQVNVARAEAQLAQSELERAQALVSRGFVSKADVQRRTATRDQALARVRVAQAAVAEQRARTGRLDIRAPAAGLILTRQVEPGQIVGQGSGVLFRMAEGGRMEMQARLAESDLIGLPVGSRATVTPVGSERSFPGQVWQVSPVIDPQTRQGIARIALGYDRALRPGGFAAAQIVKGATQAPLLPDSAVLSDQQGSFVYVVDARNRAVRRDVKIGQVSDAGVAIAEGLDGTERVVLSAGGFLTPGQTVKPVVQARR
ncbi:efflux RND transporter periplasmic adaptor subunit [Sphingomonas lenta]|uniref:Efflux transporter periplasmic adaptor subunit n=1 Tax=Sphingomonas lenta TaxID=1141887 RepID=A0A2A2SFL7_9SPHN|nr:efflux RND transporter periplasmic adaptor subunit [Sphingomonas lenta]PAX08056.1 efflux transporter periplasmic adaptor subunit [Sphingomonas lenta]